MQVCKEVQRGNEMMYAIMFLLGLMIGGVLGAWIICAMVAAGEADRREENWFYERSDKPKSGD